MKRSIQRRMGKRINQKVDASDILQDAYLVAAKKIHHFREDPTVPFLVWMMQICSQTFSASFRSHFKSKKRSVLREEVGNEELNMSQLVVDPITSPSSHLARKEAHENLLMILDSMKSTDREILYLKHIEQLSIEQIALQIGITFEAAKKRQLRAFNRLVKKFDEVLPTSENEKIYSETVAT